MPKSPYLMMADYLHHNYTFVYNEVLNRFAVCAQYYTPMLISFETVSLTFQS